MGTLRTLLITIMALFGVAMSQPAEAGKGRETTHYCFTSDNWGFCLQLIAAENESVEKSALAARLEDAVKTAYPEATKLSDTNWDTAYHLGIAEQVGELSVVGMERKRVKAVLRDIFTVLHPETTSPSTSAPAAPATGTKTAEPSNSQSTAAPGIDPLAPAQVSAPRQHELLFTQMELETARAAGHDEGRREAEEAASSKLAELATQNATLKQERDNFSWLLRAERKNVAAMSAAHNQTKEELLGTKKELGEAAAALALVRGQLASTQQVADTCHGDLAGAKNVNADLSGTLKKTRVLGGVGLFAMLGIGVAIGRISANRQKGDSAAIEPKNVRRVLHGGVSAGKEVLPPPTAQELIPRSGLEALNEGFAKTLAEGRKSSKASQELEALDASGYLAKEAEKTNLSTGESTIKKDEVLEVVEEPEPPTVRLSGEATLSGDPTRDTAQYPAETMYFIGRANNFLDILTARTWEPNNEVVRAAKEVCDAIQGLHPDGRRDPLPIMLTASLLCSQLSEVLEVDRKNVDRSTERVRILIGEARKLCQQEVDAIDNTAGKRAAS